MKAKELITALQRLNPNTPVYIGERGRPTLHEVCDTYKLLLSGNDEEFVLEWSNVPVL